MRKIILSTGLLILAVLLLFRLSQYALFANNDATELILALSAMAFFFVGVLFYRKFGETRNKDSFTVDYKTISRLKISEREYEVLEQLNHSLSNREIAERLFLSESTIKTHVSALLKKLEVRNRTALVDKARTLQLVKLPD